MSEEFLGNVPIIASHRVEAPLTPAVEAPTPSPLEAQTPEQVQATDAVFSQEKEKESQTVAGLLGLWTGSLLLNDLAQEHFHLPAEEERTKNKKKRRPGVTDEE